MLKIFKEINAEENIFKKKESNLRKEENEEYFKAVYEAKRVHRGYSLRDPKNIKKPNWTLKAREVFCRELFRLEKEKKENKVTYSITAIDSVDAKKKKNGHRS